MTGLDEKIEQALDATEQWYRGLRLFSTPIRNPSGTVEGFRGPTLLSEADCAFHFARHLQPFGVDWEDLHLELSRSEWLFGADHPASATGGWRCDLVVANEDTFLQAALPAAADGYAFDAMFECKRLGPGSNSGRRDVEEDIEKVARCYLAPRITRLGYVLAFVDSHPKRTPLDAAWLSKMCAAHPGVGVRVLLGG
jgi:hypothetical protein